MPDWRTEIPEARRRPMRAWLWSVAAMTFAVIVIGGITRLTLSGLSIVEWRPFAGVVPPLGEAQWRSVFEQYQQYPEYRTWRSAMTLAEFKSIFMWEYLHRIAARTIGLVFLLPFIFFLVRGWFTRPLLRRALVLFLLGVMQGFMGWFMVMSGLVDRPSVSHFRLAAHFSLALIILGYAVWLARDLRLTESRPRATAGTRSMRGWLVATGAVLCVQIVWGAFTAGLKAGRYYPTFPLMGGRLVPVELTAGSSAVGNITTEPVSVQWMHRVIGTALALTVILLFIRVRRIGADPSSQRLSLALLLLVVVQYALGVLTVLHAVPVPLGVLHQATAVVTFGAWLIWLHHVHNLQPES